MATKRLRHHGTILEECLGRRQAYKSGKLKRGKDGKGGTVKSRKQAIAIGL
jgi:hypothetical protein